MRLHSLKEPAVPRGCQSGVHQNPSPLLRANSPSTHRFSSVRLGYRYERTLCQAPELPPFRRPHQRGIDSKHRYALLRIGSCIDVRGPERSPPMLEHLWLPRFRPPRLLSAPRQIPSSSCGVSFSDWTKEFCLILAEELACTLRNGQQPGGLTFNFDKEDNDSRCAPRPWAIFRAAS